MHHAIERDAGLAEDLWPPCADIGRGQEHLDAVRIVHPPEVDAPVNHVAQRVEVERVEIVGRELLGQELHQNEARRVVEAPIAHHNIDRRAADRAQAGGCAGRRPEAFEALAGLVRAADRHAIGERDRVHRSGAGAAHRLDAEPLVCKELVEHTPGEGTVRAAPLQGKLDGLCGLPAHSASLLATPNSPAPHCTLASLSSSVAIVLG